MKNEEKAFSTVDVNAGTKVLTHEDNKDEDSDEFDPWALPELKDLGPKWSGKFSDSFSPFFSHCAVDFFLFYLV